MIRHAVDLRFVVDLPEKLTGPEIHERILRSNIPDDLQKVFEEDIVLPNRLGESIWVDYVQWEDPNET